MDAKLLEQFTLRLIKKNGIDVDIGAQHSIKCQFAQIENVVRDALNEIKAEMVSELQTSFDSDGFNGRGDGTQPLICLESAQCAVEDFLTK